MGVYINMEMPEDSDMIVIYSDGTARKYLSYTKVIIDEAKAVPIPLHGRLIDADELKKKHHWTDDFYETEYVEVEDIDAAPTIIPAEGEIT